ncbi:mac-1 [Pristionchus pacificus]|uniref:Mac-1 n=1 Tax=Pristionchus pacificus TaxID=54126 RepID=A0A2A6B7M9_PRIPA|nr:mac-1 [Pristionchus pacificus]|eukprot:PDM61890.1 mac-1 [Pristionchus pacificus]
MSSSVRGFSSDPKLIHRVREHIEGLEEHEDVDEIAYALQQKFPREYARKKKAAFEKMVKEALNRLGVEDAEIPDRKTRKRKRASSLNKSMEEVVISSSDNDDVEMVEEHDKKTTNGANNSVRSLYSKPATPASPAPVSAKATPAPTPAGKKKKRESAPRGLAGAAKAAHTFELTESKVTFKEIGGCEEQKLEICRLSMHVARPRTFNLLNVEPPKGCLIHGPPGCGKTMFAQAVAGEFGVPIVQLAVTELVSGVSGETEERIRNLFETAKKNAPCIVILDDIDAIAPKKETATREMERRVVSQICSSLDELFGTCAKKEPKLKFGANGDVAFENEDEEEEKEYEGKFRPVLVIGTTSRIESVDGGLRRAGRFDCEISIGIPDEASRFEILTSLCKVPLDDTVSLATVAHLTPGYVGADLNALVREAAKCAVNRIFDNLVKREKTDSFKRLTKQQTKEELDKVLAWLSSEDDPSSLADQGGLIVGLDDFHRALLNVQPSAKREGFATVPDVTWDDIGALKIIRDELEWSILNPVRNPGDFAAIGLSLRAQGILLCGPPGCGKTLVAKAVANESGLNFISVKGPELLNMYVGESERAVRTVFQRARDSSPCVIFFDEIDALCAKRSSHEGSGSARLVNQFLTEMDGVEGRKQVFIIGATNRPDMVDAAILRPGRLDKILFVDLPNHEDRADIIRKSTKNGTKPRLAAEVNIDEFAADERLEGFTGADIVQVVHQAGILALKERRDRGEAVDAVTAAHLARAVDETRPSVTPEEIRKYTVMKERFTKQMKK